MSLHNVDSSSGELIATDTDGYAISKPIEQETAENDFSIIKNINCKYEFINISESSTIDKLITSEKIKDGDKLVLVKDDDSIYEFTASGVTELLSYITPDMTSANTPSGYSVDGSSEYSGWEKWEAFSDSIWVSAAKNTGSEWLSLTLPESKNIIKYSGLFRNDSSGATQIEQIIFSGYDGSSWTTIDVFDLPILADKEAIERSFTNESSFISYKLTVSSSGSNYKSASKIKLYGSDLAYEMDTTSITQGEIPSKGYRTDEKIEFNSNEINISNIIYNGETSEEFPAENVFDVFMDSSSIASYYLTNNTLGADGIKNGTENELEYSIINNKLNAITDGEHYGASFPIVNNEFISFVAIVTVPQDLDSNIYLLSLGNEDSSRRLNINIAWNSSENNYVFHVKWRDGTINGDYNYYSVKPSVPIDINEGDTAVIYFERDTSSQLDKCYINGIIVDVIYSELYSANTQKRFNDNVLIGCTTDNTSSSYYVNNIQSLFFFNRPLTNKEILQFSDEASYLKVEHEFDNLDLSTRSIETKVQMSATGNKMTELKFDIWRKE